VARRDLRRLTSARTLVRTEATSLKALDREEEHGDDISVLRRARVTVVDRAKELGYGFLADDAALVVSELVTNALLHGGGCTGVAAGAIEGGLRIEVRDGSRVPPMLGRPSDDSLTGRGLRLVASLSARWGSDPEDGGKVVWAELSDQGRETVSLDEDELLAMWDDEPHLAAAGDVFHVELGDVPTDLLLSAKSHVDNLVREFALAAAGAEARVTAEVPAHLAALVSAVVDRFADARLAIKRQALDAANRGEVSTNLALDLPASAADAAEDYMRALDEVDAYCRARRLLTLESSPQHRLFRHWYIEELVTQLRAAAAGHVPPKAQPFTTRLLAALDTVAAGQRTSERSARLYTVAAALATAASPEEVAAAVLDQGVAELGASGGGILLATDADRLALPAAGEYDESVLARLRTEPRDAHLPAATALRTGEPVWLESRQECDERFPELTRLEPSTVALTAVPLEVKGRRLGALRFSFTQARLFDEDERRFVLALAAQTAQALERAQLQRSRVDVSRRLQRSLLPPSIPAIPDLEMAAIYHPFGDQMDVGGDFYDIWTVGPDKWAIAIGDAAGTGPEAAALTAVVRHTLRALTLSETEPGRVVGTLNAALLAAAQDTSGERFCTALFGLVTTRDGVQLWAASGGHPPPMIRRGDGRIETVPMRGSLLGLFTDVDVESVRITLGPGDTMVLVTDGVLEARRGSRYFDVDGVAQVLATAPASASAVASALEQAVLRHTGGSLVDDMAAVVVRVPEASPPA
jgi:serine phosphatase RsbU (regulator of sigma subunit)